MAIYMKYGAVNGASTAKGFEKWIELDSLQFAVDHDASALGRGSATHKTPAAKFSDITITKVADVASPKLMEDSWLGKMTQMVAFKFTTTSVGAISTFMEVQLSNCLVSHFAFGAPKEGNPTENLRLNFTKIVITHIGADTKVGGAPVRVGWDLQAMRPASG